MSGPRVSTGSESRQDYSTPADFLAAVARRFGPVAHDLAAHAGNAKARRYFAPALLRESIEEGESAAAVASALAHQGGDPEEAAAAIAAIDWASVPAKKGRRTAVVRVQNRDPAAVAFDSLAQPWRELDGLLWLNPEFADIGPWARKCAEESRAGARVGLLVPAAVGTGWYRDHVAPWCDTYFLGSRLCFDGKHPFPKDCLFAHFRGAAPTVQIWDWRADVVFDTWGYGARPALQAGGAR